MILIKARHILTQNKKRQIIKDGAIVIEEDKIKDLGTAKSIAKKYAGKIKKILEIQNGVAMPGLINTHTHLAMALLRGYADDMPLEQWWREKIFPFESKLTAEDIYWGTLLGGLEMIKSGTTFFADFYFFADGIARAVKKLGLRANIGIPILDAKTPEFDTPDQALKSIPQIISRHKDEKLIDFSVAPHMIQTVSLKTYKKCKKIADKYKLFLQTHLAETKSEIEFSQKKYKKPPAELLIKNRVIDSRSLVAHCCYLNQKEIKLLAQEKVKISHCPISNMKLASGVKPLDELLEAGAIIGLGTDGASSNNNLDMFEEMKMAALLHKVNRLDPTAASAQTILDMATINGAKTVGKEKEIGSLERGKKADIIILDFNQPHLMPLHNIVSHLVYSANGHDVMFSIIDGKIVMENRRVKIINEVEVLNAIKEKYS